MPVVGYLTRGNTKALMPAVSTGGAKGGPNTTINRVPTMEQRRMLGLCFKYGDQYGPGYQCKRHLLNMEGVEGKEEENQGEEEQEEKNKEAEDVYEEDQGQEGG